MPFTNRTFDDHGAYFEELYIQYENEKIRIFLGKYDPSFGTAWDNAPGVFGTSMPEDYQLVERIGGGVATTFETMYLGMHTVTANLFFADTTVFSESVITNRGRTRLADGGASNTESLNSFSVTWDIEGFSEAPGLTTHVGFVHQARGIGGVRDENGFVIGAINEHEFSNGTLLTAILEVAFIDHFGGGAADNTYITAGAQYNFGDWNVAASGTVRRITETGMPSVSDHLFQVGGGYEFQEGFLGGTAVDVALGFQEDGGVGSTMFGIVISREFEFELAAR
jgi:hypothetical protein